MDWTIYVDMDGVLARFSKGACRLHGRESMYIEDSWHPTWDIWDHMGLSKEDFWKTINEAGQIFWSSLEPYPWHFALLNLAERHGAPVIASDASASCHCPSGKASWLEQHAPHLAEDYHFTKKKSRLSQPGTILIDDNEKQVSAFLGAKNPGKAILFPQPWNRNRHLVHDRLGYVEQQLKGIQRDEESYQFTHDRGLIHKR